MRLSLLLRAFSTVLHWWGLRAFPALGHYVPYKFASSCTPLGEEESVGWLAERMEAELPRYLQCLESAARHNGRLAEIEAAAGEGAGRPRFDQHWFTGLDAALAYGLVRERGPRRVVEVGSGHSTRFLAQAIADARAPTELVSIDPAPRRDIDALCDEVHRAVVSEAPASLFAALEAGDVLFIDGSHVAVPGSDVDYLFTRVLPRMAPGVLVHVHDVFVAERLPPGLALERLQRAPAPARDARRRRSLPHPVRQRVPAPAPPAGGGARACAATGGCPGVEPVAGGDVGAALAANAAPLRSPLRGHARSYGRPNEPS